MASENEKRETVADILAEMFEFSDKRIEEGRDHVMTSESVGLIVHQLARRFEAAWKRERAELVYAYDPTKACKGRLPDGSAYALEAMRDPVTERHAVGNAAAMREALREAIGETCAGCKRDCDDCMNLKSGWMKKAKAALSAPARNVDKFTSLVDALNAWRETPPNESWSFDEWLFATEKGGAE